MTIFILINLIIQQIFDFPASHQWSDTGRYIYNSNTAQNPGYYSYWHWIEYIKLLQPAATTFDAYSFGSIEWKLTRIWQDWFDIDKIEREGDVYAAHHCLDWQYNIYQRLDQIFQEFSITFFPMKVMIHLSCKVKSVVRSYESSAIVSTLDSCYL